MKLTTLTAAAGIFACAIAGAASANVITSQTFDSDPELSSTQAPGKWYTDRYAPAEFDSQDFDGDSRLRLGLSEDEGQVDRSSSYGSSFYNTQGRKFDTPGATSLMIDMYIDSSFQGYNGRVGGLWGTAVDSADNIRAYPIIDFYGDGSVNQFQVWTGSGYTAIGTPSNFAFDTWVTLGIELDTETDTVTAFAGDASLSFGANGSVSFANAIIQGNNTFEGITRDIYFDNFKATAPAPIPLPATLPMLAAAIGFVGFMRRRAA